MFTALICSCGMAMLPEHPIGKGVWQGEGEYGDVYEVNFICLSEKHERTENVVVPF